MENFRETMLAIKQHHSTSIEPFVFAFALKTSEAPLPDAVAQATNNFHSSTTDFSNDQQTVLTNNSQSYTNDKNYNSFKEKMEANAAAAKQKSDAAIDRYTDDMITAGEQHPEHQDAIANTYSTVLNFFNNNVINKIADFAANIVSSIVQWVDQVFSKIKDFFTNAADEIGGFFSSVF